MSFTADVSRIAEKMNTTAEEVARRTFVAVFESVIMDTPVDTGRLRGNWQATTLSPAQGKLDRFGHSGPFANVKAVVHKPNLYYLTNNLPYAERIEYDGWSHTKAPRGMVRINVTRMESILRRQMK